MSNNKQTKNSPPSSEFEHEDRCSSCGSPCNIHTDLDDKDYCNDCRIMTNNKAREYTSPLIEELLNEVTPEETERTNREMENMDKKCKTKNIQVILESLDPTGVSTKKNEFTMKVIDDTECMRVERLYLHVGDCLYRIDNKGVIIDRVVPHE